MKKKTLIAAVLAATTLSASTAFAAEANPFTDVPKDHWSYDALAMLALFHWIVDVLGWRRWTIVFDPVGKNSLLAYILSMVRISATIQGFLFAGLCKWADKWGSALTGLTSYLVVWSILYFFKQKKIFLKV